MHPRWFGRRKGQDSNLRGHVPDRMESGPRWPLRVPFLDTSQIDLVMRSSFQIAAGDTVLWNPRYSGATTSGHHLFL